MRSGAPVSYFDVAALWRRDDIFSDFFIGLLAQTPFEAYCWETPSVTLATVRRPFEFALVDSAELARLAPDPAPFAAEMRAGVSTFPNLGGDALLVAPCRQGPLSACAHLAAFARGAPTPHQHALWRAVGEAVADRLGPQPLWVSTAGLGVAWLHIRLDSRPKYYAFDPYRISGDQ